jgi:Fur family transcriptional regulator, peroxide stress response regulator
LKPIYEEITNKLRNKNIRLSHQRLKVLEYLTQNQCHPTVDKIYSSLHKEFPTLSKTTIYNTLDTLAEAGLVKVISIEGNEARYDITTEDHGHFKCDSCGSIHDFDIDIDICPVTDLSDFKITDRNVYFKGVCPQCLLNTK